MKKKEFENLQEHLDGWAMGEDIDEVCEYLKGKGLEFADEGIDDGGEEDGEYIMYRVYSIGRYDVKLYYSNADYNVSWILYRE